MYNLADAQEHPQPRALGGTVTDPNGAVVSGAKVRVSSRANGEVRTAQSGARGGYLGPAMFPNMDPLNNMRFLSAN